MKGLTKRQSEILQFVEDHVNKNHFSPSYREIMDHFGFSSLGTVYQHVQVLKRKGFLLSEKNVKRSLITNRSLKPDDEIKLPFIGHICAGSPIDLFPQSQTMAVPRFLVHNPERTYLLRARGNSLNEELINDGDLLIVEGRNEPIDGETTVILINGQDTMIKKFFQKETFIELQSCHGNHQPITLHEETIIVQGIVLGLIRVY